MKRARHSLCLVLLLGGMVNAQESNVGFQTLTQTEESISADSRADQLRRARRDAEMSTETKLVEKLEASRLEDERRRADALFGRKTEVAQPTTVKKIEEVSFEAMAEQAPVQQAQIQQAAPAVQATAQLTEEEKRRLIREEVANELARRQSEEAAQAAAARTAVRTEVDLAEVTQDVDQKFYVGATLGGVNYSDAYNVKSDAAFGVVVGVRLDERMIVEGGFVYSNSMIGEGYWDSQFPIWKQMEQYNYQVALKYDLFVGNKFRPYIGGAGSYTFRQYSDPTYQAMTNSSVKTGDSHAFDVGPVVGFDLDLNENLTVGVDFRYFFNLTDNVNSRYLSTQYLANDQSLIENMSYFLISAGVKFRF